MYLSRFVGGLLIAACIGAAGAQAPKAQSPIAAVPLLGGAPESDWQGRVREFTPNLGQRDQPQAKLDFARDGVGFLGTQVSDGLRAGTTVNLAAGLRRLQRKREDCWYIRSYEFTPMTPAGAASFTGSTTCVGSLAQVIPLGVPGVAGGFGQAPEGSPKKRDPGAPSVLYRPRPEYTAEALQMHLEGVVQVQVRVRADGVVEVLGVLRGLGHGLDEGAMRTVQAMRFKPATDSAGTAIDWSGVISVSYQLPGGGRALEK